MITGKKHFAIYLAVVVLIGVTFGVLPFLYKNQPTTPIQPTVRPTIIPKAAVKKILPLVLGTVQKVVGSTVYFTNAGNVKTVALTPSGTVVKQIQNKKGPATFIPIKISDMKAGNMIVVSYDSVSRSGLEYMASKIEVISSK